MNDLSAAPRPERQRKPDWIRVKAPVSKTYHETRALMRELNLNTVCEEAACPNIGECWSKKHATVMILGDVCTRACAFCNVKTGMPRKVDPLEPEHVAIAAAKLGDRKSTRLNSSHLVISYAVFCLKKKIERDHHVLTQQVDSIPLKRADKHKELLAAVQTCHDAVLCAFLLDIVRILDYHVDHVKRKTM